MSLDQHFDALIELLQDKPQKVMLETLRGFNARLAKAWTVRHNRPKKGRKVIAHSQHAWADRDGGLTQGPSASRRAASALNVGHGRVRSTETDARGKLRVHFAASGIADKLQRIQGTVPESTWRAYATRRIELALVSELHRQPAGRGRKP